MSSKAFSHNVQPVSLAFRHCCRQTRNLRTQPRDTFSQCNDDSEKSYYPGNAGIATPREVFFALRHLLYRSKIQLVQYLNQYIIGQENAKKVLSVAYVPSFIML